MGEVCPLFRKQSYFSFQMKGFGALAVLLTTHLNFKLSAAILNDGHIPSVQSPDGQSGMNVGKRHAGCMPGRRLQTQQI